MHSNWPRHARQSGKRRQVERSDVIGIVIGLAGIVISILFGLGIIRPLTGQPLAPGPVVNCYGYCPVTEVRSPSP